MLFGGPLDVTFRRPAKFSVTGAVGQCNTTQNIDVDISYAKGGGGSKGVVALPVLLQHPGKIYQVQQEAHAWGQQGCHYRGLYRRRYIG